MLKIIILEDENKAACMLQDCIKLVAPDCKIEGIASNLSECKTLIRDVKPDLAFFDVELPDGHSFDLLTELSEINFSIIFTTAHSKYAVSAFRFSAIDYVIKPITPDAISEAISKAKEAIYFKQMRDKIDNLLLNTKLNDDEKKIVLHCSDTIHFISLKEIIRCNADNNYTFVYLTNGTHILASKTIKDFEQMLPESMFFRCHQSHIVNISFISQVKKKTFEVILANGDKVQLATRKKEALLAVMKTK